MKGPWAAIGAGLCAILLGIGLQRFAYGPLQPAMVERGWVSAAQAGTLGALNFCGYLLGTLAAVATARRLGTRRALRAGMVAATLCLALCALNGGFGWFVLWRSLAGAAGGVLMVLAGPAIQTAVPARMRATAGGLLFLGPGGGIVIAALLVPALLPLGLPATWLALAALALLLTALSWRFWPDPPAPARVRGGALPRGRAGRLVLAYGLGGLAIMPHMAWWPDYVARGLGRGTEAGALAWLTYGLAAMAAPTLCGMAADRIGTFVTWRAMLGLNVVALALPFAGPSIGVLAASGLIAGAANIGQTSLTLARAREVAGEGAPRLWGTATAALAVGQVSAGLILAWLYARTGTHLPLFGFGLAGAVAALAAGWRE